MTSTSALKLLSAAIRISSAAIMHRSMRLLSLELPSLPASRPLYVCFNCRHEPLPRPFAAHQIRHNSGSTSVTERIRRKLWGTDRPPGLKDPYGGRGILERRLGRKGQSDADAQQVSEADIDSDEFADIAPPDDYIPATTWDDLERIGHLGKWSDYSPKKEDTYKRYGPFLVHVCESSADCCRFMAKERIWGTDVDNAARMAAVEICLLHKLNKPPTSACHVLEHDKDIQKLLMKCRIDSNAAADWGSAVVFPGREAKEILIYVFDQIGDLGKKHNEKTAQRPQQQGTLGSKEVKAGLFHVDTFKALSLNDPTIRFAVCPPPSAHL